MSADIPAAVEPLDPALAEPVIVGPEGTEAAPAPAAPAVTETDRPTAVVRYGAMGLLGRFVNPLEQWRCNQRVVIKSDRGQEIGAVVCKWGGCGSPGGVPPQIRGEVLRTLTHADEVEDRHLHEGEQREFAFCRERIQARSLPMKLVLVEHLFGGDRILFYFVSETRVDFRALVRDLAHEFQTRIEMRQIGVRDEARLLGDYERCGRPLCCRAWIKELEPVSMKMAKVQKATLDPTKISGRCGRLMCCLRFEHATYRDLAKNLPRKNSLVGTAVGRGKVVDTDIVSQMVGVLLENGNRVNVPVESLLPPDAAPPAGTPAAAGESVREPEPPAEEPEEEAPESRVASEPQPERPAPGPPATGQPGPPVPPATGQPGPPGPPGDPEHRRRRGRRRSRRGGRNRGRPPEGGAPGAGPDAPPLPSPGGPGSPPPADRGSAPSQGT